ncbi:hypothetical protein GW832_03395 [bacterium]|nr:hypothetical protein [bacterium]
MSSITDQQFESILLRLESGESMGSVQADFPHLTEDIAALQDLQDFFSAQRTLVKPNPQGLKSVLRQVDLLNTPPEDDSTWGSFFTSFSRYAGVALPAVLVLGVSGYVWQSQVPASVAPSIVSDQQEVALVSADALPMARKMVAPAAMMMADSMPVSVQTANAGTAEMDMEALAQSLSDEFANDMAEFESTKESLEPIFTEQLFSYQPTSSL